MKKLDEKTMNELESLIPHLAESAFKQARTRALASGRSIVEAKDGKLIETYPGGTHRVIKSIPAPISVTVGQKRIRRVK